MNELKMLFEPIKIGSLELKNRIKFPPVATGYSVNDEVTDRLKSFYAERAKGGAALIGITTFPTKLNQSPAPGIYDDRFIPGLGELVAICHACDAKAYTEMLVTYSWSFDGCPVELVSPSGITVTGRVDPPFRVGGPQRGTASGRRALEEFEILEIVEAFGEGARRAREAGFDGIEFMAAAGYLVSQFLSPLTNKRTDRYGGSLENRMRFLMEIIERTQDKVGKDYPLMCRISPQFAKDGLTLDDIKKIAPLLEKAGIHALDITPGWHEDPVAMIQPQVAQGAWAYMAGEVKKTVGVPVAAGTNISDPFVAEKILAEGKADLVYMARALIADPELPNKAREGRVEEIRPCIACNLCFETLETQDGITCSVNPRAGNEGKYIMELAAKPKNVFVIGGGPAGMQAAITADQRGHKVTLFEQRGELGGQLLTAVIPPHKEPIKKLCKFLIGQVEKSDVEVRLNARTIAEAIREGEPDVVIVATGATPIIPHVSGVTGTNVMTALDALTQPAKVGEKVIVVGGGMVGCEVAEFLTQRGKKIIILEMLKQIASDVAPFTRWTLIQRLREAGITIETNVKLDKITEKGVEGIRAEKSEAFEGDTVILAVGMVPSKELAEELKSKVKQVYLIGDCAEPRLIKEAIGEGFQIAWEI